MKVTKFISWLKPFLVLSIICGFALTATAQNYYPVEVGNTWVFLSADGTEQRTYTIEGPENVDGEELIVLKITTEALGTDIFYVDKYFITVESDGGLILHQSAVDQRALGIAEATYDPPATFFPAALPLGHNWEIVTNTELKLVGPTTSTSTIEVAAIEDVETPIGVFKGCVKLDIKRKVVTAVVIQRYNFVQWLAPNVGPVKYLDVDQDILFELQSYNLVEAPTAEEAPPEEPTVAEEVAGTEDAPAVEDTPPAEEVPLVEETPPTEQTPADEPAAEMPVSQMFKITLTNLTTGEPGMGGQIFSPPVFVTHRAGIHVATVGEPATPPLIALAENGDTSLLVALAAAAGANSVAADGMVPPGGSITVTVTADAVNSSLSVGSMLVSTNDAFIAATDVALFDEAGMPVSASIDLMAYDAGSEDNTELASDIPGPLGLDADADPEGSNARVPTEGGVVALHEGIQGGADVSEAFAWTEPTAMLMITPVEVPAEPMVEEPMMPKEYGFDVTLEPGLNMISIPLMPEEPYTAKSFAAMLEATLVIRLDLATQGFSAYTTVDEGTGFSIDGGKGYIVNTPTGGIVKFTGTAWDNQSDAADDAPAAPTLSTNKNTWAFVVTSDIRDMETGTGYTLVAENLRTGTIATETITSDVKRSSAVWADLNRKSVVEAGDKLEIALYDERGNIVSGPFQRTVSTDDIRNAFLSLQLTVGDVRPKDTILAQNYPNPFNPETWIPYQLSKSAEVSIHIHNVAGHLIRTLDLGLKPTGSYMTPSTAAYWDGKNSVGERVASGIYFYTLQTTDFAATRRMVILK